jgi:hypothetical protein
MIQLKNKFIFVYLLEYQNVTCFDQNADCANLAVFCGTGANGVDEMCPQTCGACTSKQKFKKIKNFV